MGTIGAYIGVLLLLFGAPIVFLSIMIADLWRRYRLRRDVIQYYASDSDNDWEDQEYVRKVIAQIGGQNERLAARVFVLIPVGWVIAVTLYFIYGQ